MEHRILLDTDETEGQEFNPPQSWWLGIDRFVEDIEMEWKSPTGRWVPINVFDSPVRHWVQAPGVDYYRFVTKRAGSRVWGTW